MVRFPVLLPHLHFILPNVAANVAQLVLIPAKLIAVLLLLSPVLLFQLLNLLGERLGLCFVLGLQGLGPLILQRSHLLLESLFVLADPGFVGLHRLLGRAKLRLVLHPLMGQRHSNARSPPCKRRTDHYSNGSFPCSSHLNNPPLYRSILLPNRKRLNPRLATAGGRRGGRSPGPWKSGFLLPRCGRVAAGRRPSCN